MKLWIRLAIALMVLLTALSVNAQQEQPRTPEEKRVALSERAVAHDNNGAAVLEATLRTTELNGAFDDPITNVRIIVRNTSATSYSFVSGVVTFYDAAGIRCGEGIFKADVLAADESFETDTPGLRIRCQVSTWRIVATHLLPRTPPIPPPPPRP
jgi:hypothetical protein